MNEPIIAGITLFEIAAWGFYVLVGGIVTRLTLGRRGGGPAIRFVVMLLWPVAVAAVLMLLVLMLVDDTPTGDNEVSD